MIASIKYFFKPSCYPHFFFGFVEPDVEPFCEKPDASEECPAPCRAV